VHDFRKLLVWQLARELGTDVYRLCAGRPRDESVVTTQLRRSALSIATNIAEGCGKSPRPEVIRYLAIAAGSAAETEHHLRIWQDIGGIDAQLSEELLARVTSIRRMLHALMLKLPE
jgi:four helix bundle protein